MKGQMTLEFLVILLIIASYLSVVFGLFISSKSSLESAVDAKLTARIGDWIGFIAARPEGTQVLIDVSPFPGRFISVSCGERTGLTSPSGTREIGIPSVCAGFNFTVKGCLSIERIGEGVGLEVC